VVGIGGSDCAGFDYGAASLLAGATGATLHNVCGTSSSLFGYEVAGDLDIDLDGIADFIVTAKLDNRGASSAGAYTIYSGDDGSVLREELGTLAGQVLGSAVATLEDLDSDGARDYAVGSTKTGAGFVTVYSGVDGSVILTLQPSFGNRAFGTAIADAGDVDGDGLTDVVVGDYRGDGSSFVFAGLAWVFSGADGSVIWSLEGEQDDAQFGYEVDGVGDVDLDGYDDFMVGSPRLVDSLGDPAGKTYVYSGGTGTLLFSHPGDCEGGWDVSTAGDVNADGYPDFLIADPSGLFGCSDDRINLVSGRNGLLLYHWEYGTAAGAIAIEGGTDLDGDGRLEMVAGLESNDEAAMDAGAVFAYSLERFYCDAMPKVVGLGPQTVDITMGQTDPGKLIGLALVGFDGVPTFAFLAIAPADSLGRLFISGDVPSDASGHTADFQAFAVGFNGKIVASAVETLTFL
jgi:hypothetical protein